MKGFEPIFYDFNFSLFIFKKNLQQKLASRRFDASWFFSL